MKKCTFYICTVFLYLIFLRVHEELFCVPVFCFVLCFRRISPPCRKSRRRWWWYLGCVFRAKAYRSHLPFASRYQRATNWHTCSRYTQMTPRASISPTRTHFFLLVTRYPHSFSNLSAVSFSRFFCRRKAPWAMACQRRSYPKGALHSSPTLTGWARVPCEHTNFVSCHPPLEQSIHASSIPPEA